MILEWLRDTIDNFLRSRKRRKKKKVSSRKQKTKKVRGLSAKKGRKKPVKKASKITTPKVRITRTATTRRFGEKPQAIRPSRITVKKEAVEAKPVPTKKGAPPTRKAAVKRVGVITHYFGKIHVAVLKIESPLKTGDAVEIRRKGLEVGNEIIASMQINHKAVKQARRGDEVGIKLKTDARNGDEIVKL